MNIFKVTISFQTSIDSVIYVLGDEFECAEGKAKNVIKEKSWSGAFIKNITFISVVSGEPITRK